MPRVAEVVDGGVVRSDGDGEDSLQVERVLLSLEQVTLEFYSLSFCIC